MRYNNYTLIWTGQKKKEKAVEGIVAMLSEKGITVTELEIDMLIESCVAEAKNVFNKAT